MFFKHSAYTIIAWGLLAAGCYILLFLPSCESVAAYQCLLERVKSQKAACQEELVRSKSQARFGTSKQILYHKGMERLQSRISSAFSDLSYTQAEGELVEHFQDFSCAVQENAQLRQFKAKEAFFSYKSGKLKAKDVKIADYHLLSSLWPEAIDSQEPSAQGQAKAVQLSLFETPSFKAEGFQAEFFGLGDEK